MMAKLTSLLQSDIDLVAIVDSDLPCHVFIRTAADAAAAEPPDWMLEGSISEVLQTAKAPVLTFDYIISGESCSVF